MVSFQGEDFGGLEGVSSDGEDGSYKVDLTDSDSNSTGTTTTTTTTRRPHKKKVRGTYQCPKLTYYFIDDNGLR